MAKTPQDDSERTVIEQQAAPPGPATASDAQPGDTLLNPAQPLAPTVVPPPADVSKFLNTTPGVSGYPKRLYHPVHGEVEVADPGQEASLKTPRDWFATPEQADAARTATEAWIVQHNNMRAKLKAHDDAGHALVRNSNAADQSIRSGQPEPL
jgi:hypothetical protein